jgi:hypothetical protein
VLIPVISPDGGRAISFSSSLRTGGGIGCAVRFATRHQFDQFLGLGCLQEQPPAVFVQLLPPPLLPPSGSALVRQRARPRVHDQFGHCLPSNGSPRVRRRCQRSAKIISFVEIWRLNLRAVATDIREAHVVGKDQDDIGAARGSRLSSRERQAGRGDRAEKISSDSALRGLLLHHGKRGDAELGRRKRDQLDAFHRPANLQWAFRHRTGGAIH